MTTIERTRTLPAPGRVLRQVGDQVASTTVVADADLPSGYRLLELDRILGVRAPDAVRLMVKKVGDTVEEGEVIARSGLVFKAQCLSPIHGRILDARENRVLLEATPQHLEQTAFYPGHVTAVIPQRGVRISVRGAVVQGVWGMGSEARARLVCAVSDANAPLKAENVLPAHMGTALVAGCTLDGEALTAAVQNEVRALIVGSIDSGLCPALAGAPLSIIVTEGFGDFPMSESAFQLLRSFEGREVCFNPADGVHSGVQRPEIVVSQPAGGQASDAEYMREVQVGSLVRALRAPYENISGKVVELVSRPFRLESGVEARGAEVDLESVGQVFIPFENLEIIG